MDHIVCGGDMDNIDDANDIEYMKLALAEACGAFERGEFPVGCVIVQNGEVIATGARRGTSSAETRPSEVDHAEIRALKALDSLDYAFDPEVSVLYSTMEPCLMCYAAIILSGIKKIVYAYEDVMGGGTSCNLSLLAPLYSNSGMTVVPHVLREESLACFARFFSKKDNRYWKKSYLEQYTLEQAGGCRNRQLSPNYK